MSGDFCVFFTSALIACTCSFLPITAHAHEFRALAVRVMHVEHNAYRVTVHNPNRGPVFSDPSRGLESLTLVVPATCRMAATRAHLGPQTWSQLFTCDGELRGEVTLSGLDACLVDAVLYLQIPQAPGSIVLNASHPSVTIDAAQSNTRRSATSYFSIGVEHIAAGLDHLAFVLGLVWLLLDHAVVQRTGPKFATRRLARRLVATITAFTLGHSLALVAVTALGLQLPSPPVEALIALSVVILARELVIPATSPTLSTSHPWLMAGGFGLLHGCGFAGALREIGLGEGSFALAVAAFNLGVEAGQLCVVAGLLALLVPTAISLRPQAWRRLTVTAGYCLGIVAAAWTLARMLTSLVPP